MAFNPSPPAFKTRHWRNLYASCIFDLRTLKTVAASGASFMCLDAESWGTDSSKPAEIGISFLSNLRGTEIQASNTESVATLDAFSTSCGLETHWIRILGRERQQKYREGHRYGREHVCEAHEVEQFILDLIQQFRQKPTKQNDQSSLILAVFSHTFECRMLSAQYPEILSSGVLNSWLDLQALAAEASVKDTNLQVPSLQETLVSCGIEGQAIPKAKSQHNSATDSVRIAALLSFFVTVDSGEKLDIKALPKTLQRIHRQDPTTKKNWNGRPTPYELFPFTAKVWQETSLSKLHSAQVLRKIFKDYEPTAVGLHKDKRHGWVCLRDLGSLEDFVRRVNKSAIKGVEGTWFAVSVHDPTVVPVRDLSELKAKRNQEVHARAEEKREQRRLNKENAWSGSVAGNTAYIN